MTLSKQWMYLVDLATKNNISLANKFLYYFFAFTAKVSQLTTLTMEVKSGFINIIFIAMLHGWHLEVA